MKRQRIIVVLLILVNLVIGGLGVKSWTYIEAAFNAMSANGHGFRNAFIMCAGIAVLVLTLVARWRWLIFAMWVFTLVVGGTLGSKLLVVFGPLTLAFGGALVVEAMLCDALLRNRSEPRFAWLKGQLGSFAQRTGRPTQTSSSNRGGVNPSTNNR